MEQLIPALQKSQYAFEQAQMVTPGSGNKPESAGESLLAKSAVEGEVNLVKEHNSDPPRADYTGSTRKGPSPYPVARRSQRVTIEMPVEIVGQSVNGTAFRRETRTTVVNAHGAQLILAMTIEIQPSTLLRTLPCRWVRCEGDHEA
jgi:hypothetical protein